MRGKHFVYNKTSFTIITFVRNTLINHNLWKKNCETSRQGTLWADFLGGRMGPDERSALLGHLGDVYDYGVSRADQTLAEALDLLQDW